MLTGVIELEKTDTSNRIEYFFPQSPKNCSDKNCIDCENFTWWDGDYCCICDFSVLCRSKDGEFNEDILKTIKTPCMCSDFRDCTIGSNDAYRREYEKFINERQTCGGI